MSADPDCGPAGPDAIEPAIIRLAAIEEEWLRCAEALVFASAAPVSAQRLGQILPDAADADAVLAALRGRYAGCGVELVDAAGGVMFRTAPDLAAKLRKVVDVPRRLPRAAMETLAVIAYHQPVTRPEIEEIRGSSLSQQTFDALLEAGLIAPKGRRETPGRPTLWGTTPAFLVHFGLPDLRALPRREDLLLEPAINPLPLQEGDGGGDLRLEDTPAEPSPPRPSREGGSGSETTAAPEAPDVATPPPNPLPQGEGEDTD